MAFGIVRAAQYTRDWMPHLETTGQRTVLATMALFTGKDSTTDPTFGQLADLTGFHVRSVRRIVEQLEKRKVLERVGARPVFHKGVPKGGKVVVWAILPLAPNTAHVANSALEAHVDGSQVRPGARPSAPGSPPTSAQLGAPLGSEKTEKNEICASHSFKDTPVGPRVRRVCTTCGYEDKSTVEDGKVALPSEEENPEGGDGESLEGIQAGLDRILDKELTGRGKPCRHQFGDDKVCEKCGLNRRMVAMGVTA